MLVKTIIRCSNCGEELIKSSTIGKNDNMDELQEITIFYNVCKCMQKTANNTKLKIERGNVNERKSNN